MSPAAAPARPALPGLKSPNIQALADHLGLARSTVSRALRGDPLIAAKTRARVQESAERLGYRKNPYLSVLMARIRAGSTPTDTPVVAFINPQSTRDGWRDYKPMHTAYQAAAARARELGYQLQEFWLGERGMTPQRVAEILRARGIRAVILGSPGHPSTVLPFDTTGFAAVAIDLDPSRDHLHRATADYLGNTLKALQSMRALGYRRIGLVIDNDTFRRMRQFPRMALLEFEQSLPHADRAGCFISSADDLAGFARWLTDAKPDGIVTASLSHQLWLQSLGLRIPQDIGVAQLDPDFVPFPVSGIDGRFDVVGRNAMDLLVSQINRHEFTPPSDPMHVMNAGHWQAGATTLDRIENPTPPPYDPLRLALCQAAADGDREGLRRLRQRMKERLYREPFALARDAAPGQWEPLPVGQAANAPFCTPARQPKFATARPFDFGPGPAVFHGVPFQLPRSQVGAPDSVVLLNCESGRNNGRIDSVRIPVSGHVRALYFLHCAFFVWAPLPVAHYRLVYADGTSHSCPILPYWPPEIPSERAAIHDSWRALPHIETPGTKPEPAFGDETTFENDLFFYVHELPNPKPDRPLAAVELVAHNEGWATTLVAAITALLT